MDVKSDNPLGNAMGDFWEAVDELLEAIQAVYPNAKNNPFLLEVEKVGVAEETLLRRVVEGAMKPPTPGCGCPGCRAKRKRIAEKIARRN